MTIKIHKGNFVKLLKYIVGLILIVLLIFKLIKCSKDGELTSEVRVRADNVKKESSHVWLIK